jgi:hypothetical protein
VDIKELFELCCEPEGQIYLRTQDGTGLAATTALIQSQREQAIEIADYAVKVWIDKRLEAIAAVGGINGTSDKGHIYGIEVAREAVAMMNQISDEIITASVRDMVALGHAAKAREVTGVTPGKTQKGGVA